MVLVVVEVDRSHKNDDFTMIWPWCYGWFVMFKSHKTLGFHERFNDDWNVRVSSRFKLCLPKMKDMVFASCIVVQTWGRLESFDGLLRARKTHKKRRPINRCHDRTGGEHSEVRLYFGGGPSESHTWSSFSRKCSSEFRADWADWTTQNDVSEKKKNTSMKHSLKLASGKLLHNYGKTKSLMGKSSINDHFP
jgi:hypothetical protein